MERAGDDVDKRSKFFRAVATFLRKEGIAKGLEFKPNASDVIIASEPKGGTTWLQQICHGLRSGGNMDFEDLSMVVPSLEMGYDCGYEDLQIAQPYEPRMLKTHFWYEHCPKGAGKYIVIVRRPSDAALSIFHFFENWFFEPGDISMEDFVKTVSLRIGASDDVPKVYSTMEFISSWYPHRHDDNVLWLHYEDLIDDLRAVVDQIAKFLKIGENDQSLLELVTHQASFEFMKQNASKFNEPAMKITRNEAAGLPKDAGFKGNGKINIGKEGMAKSAFSKELLDTIQEKWTQTVASKTGHATYEAMREAINTERESSR